MFSSWFGKKQSVRRDLDDPTKLQEGDVIELSGSFGLPSELRGARFTIHKISTYEFEEGIDVEYQLKGATLFTLFLTVEDNDGDILLKFSRKVERKQVGDIFDLDDFAQIFEGDEPCRLNTKSTTGFENWIADAYIQTCQEVQAFYYEDWDLRKKHQGRDYEEDEEELRYYELKSDDGRHFVEIEVWDGGDTDVSLTLALPAYELEGIYPAEEKQDTGGW
jgi:hypothetical protein